MAPAAAQPADPVGSASLRAAQRRSAELEAVIAGDASRFTVLTGDRPTGPLHLGHYFGTLANRLRLQRAGSELFILIADYQVLTDRDVADRLSEHVAGLVADYLAIGVDPEATTIFTHSAVPALNQLMLPFLSLVSVTELQRNPTVKDDIKQSSQDKVSGLMLTYPVHQAADILFCKADLVPVGQDQLPHLEVARTVARRFNERYGGFFPIPDALLSDAPNLLGVDGRKMSKSRANAIALSATADETARLLRRAKTDSLRHVSYEPAARPEVSSLVLLAALCQGREPDGLAAEIGAGGAAELKRVVTESVNEFFRPIRARRAELASDPGYLRSVLARGNAVASAVADRTLAGVAAAMGTSYAAP
ncbi:MAG TPA: tryptophan--tRNA ligase [Streptosporangiaceae bacterium]|nr:tryptophan--tRNA ligase [Streptosporangiaceae bacterium]